MNLHYADWEYVPYAILKERVPGLSVPGANNERFGDASVYQALFNSEDVFLNRIYGDYLYE
jgi:hypothetical protein